MRDASTNVIELIIGAILMGLGLLFLSVQYTTLEELTDITIDKVIEDKEMYQQYQSLSYHQITDEELYAAIMGYREYPITIDEKLIPINPNDYSLYLSYVKEGTYEKHYIYDADRKIVQIVYEFLGTF